MTQNYVMLFGQLSNTQTPGGQTVQLGGEVSGQTLTDAYGDYSITLPAMGIGNVYAAALNGQAGAQATLSDTAPDIDSFFGAEGVGDIWTFSGHVTYRDPQGLIINLGGIPSLQGQTATVDANGNFSLTVQLSGTTADNGTATAITTDWYNLQSPYAYDQVFQT